MRDTILLDIASAISVFGHFFTIYLIMPFKRGVKLSLFVFFLFTVLLFASSYLISLEITVITNFFRGLLYLPICIFLYRGQLYQKIFAFFQNFLLTAFQAALALELARYIVPFESNRYIPCFLIVYLIMFIVYFVLLHLFWKSVFLKLFINARRSEWILYSLGAVLSFSALTVLRITLQTGPIYTFLLFFVLWGFCILCFAIINTHEKITQRLDAEFARSIVSSGRDHYRKMDAMYEKIRMLRHDYKYHLNAALKMLHSGNAKSADEYLTGLEAMLEGFEVKKYCRNSVINALIAGYAERCDKLNIKINVCIDIPEAMSIPNYDLCIIIGNLLENAVEACEKTSQDRFINLETRNTSTHLLLMVQNNYGGEIVLGGGAPESAERPVSTKANGGIGIKSVREVVSRNGGALTFGWDDAAFSAYASVKL